MLETKQITYISWQRPMINGRLSTSWTFQSQDFCFIILTFIHCFYL